jgi:predicted Zn-dependent protease with MMP-like domain
MEISVVDFEKVALGAIENLPPNFLARINNLAFFIEDYPTKEQIKKARLGNNFTLLGLYEGYRQSARTNLGPVLPDRITIFRKPILNECTTEKEIKEKIIKTIKHEIAHHFGSDERGARRAEEG